MEQHIQWIRIQMGAYRQQQVWKPVHRRRARKYANILNPSNSKTSEGRRRRFNASHSEAFWGLILMWKFSANIVFQMFFIEAAHRFIKITKTWRLSSLKSWNPRKRNHHHHGRMKYEYNNEPLPRLFTLETQQPCLYAYTHFFSFHSPSTPYIIMENELKNRTPKSPGFLSLFLEKRINNHDMMMWRFSIIL